MTNRQHIKKQRHHFANKGPYVQSYGFSSSHVQMWELDHKEEWAPKNWCFWSVMLEKVLESLLDSKEIKPVNPKGNQPWIFIGRTGAKAEAPILCILMLQPTHWNSPWCWERLRSGGEGTAEDGMAEWHHRLDGHEFEQATGVGDGQGSLVWCSPWDRKELDTTEQVNWTDK